MQRRWPLATYVADEGATEPFARRVFDRQGWRADDPLRVVFIGSDLGAGVLEAMKNEMPERFFMEGVSEANIIGMSAGMAMDCLGPAAAIV